MRLLVCGDRFWVNRRLLSEVLNRIHHDRFGPVTAVIEGEARGADVMGRDWGQSNYILVLKYPADWDKYHKAAGPIRNQQMLDEGKPDRVVAFHNNITRSKGTAHMLSIAAKAGLPRLLVSEREITEFEWSVPQG